MNATQRKQIYKLISALSGVDTMDYVAATGAIERVIADLESIRDDEQDKYDNMPESLQSSDRGDTMQEGIDDLESAIEALNTATEALTEVNEENQPKDEEADDETDENEAAQAAIDDALDFLGSI